MKIDILGGLTARAFIAEYWQKKPLLVRGAIPGFGGMLSPDELAGLACEEDAQSRLVINRRGKWRVESGPFDEARFAGLPAKGWSLLVQGVNHFLPQADELLHRFDFIPRARLDDLMVSYAPDGGGVGPHFDSYDVFLLQGSGRRLWRVSAQRDMALVPDAPLRILQHFETEQEWLLEPGDMLYLPPRLAHWGIAVGDCMTWSIGFRAPAAGELATHFLGFLQEQEQLQGMYADPDLKRQRRPALIGRQMVGKVSRMLSRIAWNDADVGRFLGTYLTEPKPHIVFERPRRISREQFLLRLQQQGIRLGLKTRMLYLKGQFFINGESCRFSGTAKKRMAELADRRSLPAMQEWPDAVVEQLHQWYLTGYLE